MTIRQRYIGSFKEAARLAFAEAQADDMKLEAATLFATTLEPKAPTKSRRKARASV